MEQELDLDEILRRNPGIDPRVVKEAQRLEAQLLRIGVEIKPEYRLEHPLDGMNYHSTISPRK